MDRDCSQISIGRHCPQIPNPNPKPLRSLRSLRVIQDAARSESAPYQGDLFATNGLTRERIAVKLISSQRAGGWWLMETNAAPTRLAIEILKGL